MAARGRTTTRSFRPRPDHPAGHSRSTTPRQRRGAGRVTLPRPRSAGPLRPRGGRPRRPRSASGDDGARGLRQHGAGGYWNAPPAAEGISAGRRRSRRRPASCGRRRRASPNRPSRSAGGSSRDHIQVDVVVPNVVARPPRGERRTRGSCRRTELAFGAWRARRARARSAAAGRLGRVDASHALADTHQPSTTPKCAASANRQPQRRHRRRLMSASRPAQQRRVQVEAAAAIAPTTDAPREPDASPRFRTQLARRRQRATAALFELADYAVSAPRRCRSSAQSKAAASAVVVDVPGSAAGRSSAPSLGRAADRRPARRLSLRRRDSTRGRRVDITSAAS